jgi:hypothetical protein
MVGDIEEMTLRWTRIRDAHGTEWYVPNRRLREVGNRSQHRGKAVIDLDLPSGCASRTRSTGSPRRYRICTTIPTLVASCSRSRRSSGSRR